MLACFVDGQHYRVWSERNQLSYSLHCQTSVHTFVYCPKPAMLARSGGVTLMFVDSWSLSNPYRGVIYGWCRVRDGRIHKHQCELASAAYVHRHMFPTHAVFEPMFVARCLSPRPHVGTM